MLILGLVVLLKSFGTPHFYLTFSGNSCDKKELTITLNSASLPASQGRMLQWVTTGWPGQYWFCLVTAQCFQEPEQTAGKMTVYIFNKHILSVSWPCLSKICYGKFCQHTLYLSRLLGVPACYLPQVDSFVFSIPVFWGPCQKSPLLITLGLGALGTLTGRNGLAQPCLGPPALGLQSWPMQGTAGYCSATAVPAHGPADPDLRPDPPPSALLDCGCLQLPQNSENPKFGDNVIENRLGRNLGKKKKKKNSELWLSHQSCFKTETLHPVLIILH